MKKILYIFLFLSLSVNTYAKEEKSYEIFNKNFKITLEWLENKPKSITKDFFIIQFLKQKGTSVEDAKEAFEMVKRKNSRILKAYRKVVVDDIPSEDLRCYRMKTKDLLKEDDKCLALGLSIKEATTLSKKQLEKAISKLDKYPTLRDDLKIISQKDDLKNLLDDKVHRFYRLFFKAGSTYRQNQLNKNLPKEFIFKISDDKQFTRFVKYVFLNKKLDKLQKSLLNIKKNKNITHKALFYLAMNAIKNKKEDFAFSYLEQAYEKAYYQFDKDKVLFWKYLLRSKKEDLDLLAQSWDNNIYSLFAKELLGIETTNIVYKLDIPNTKSSYNIYDSFSWIKVLNDTKKNFDEKKLDKYIKLFTSQATLPHLTFVLERFYKYKTSYFILPFEKIMKDFSLENKILLYSLGRQESRFIPSSISFSTALGVMQIMPFLSKAIAKRYKESYNIYEQFKPEVNITYANRHLKTLKKRFNNNPLFIAYAYNGGGGYTNSQLKKGLFKKGKYEPFLSMESISYEETRKYGKKVLANYYIYNNYLNKENPFKLSDFFKSLLR
ncbi:MAG: lytic transglycosylase domain-containing protein [Arcobacter sp.]|nr:lytic transglycosylase domain-containing protein [Arcobacter sp.]